MKYFNQYKHKTTGKIATHDQEGRFYNVDDSIKSKILADYIQNSCDWEEIKSPEYTILSFKINKTGEVGRNGNISIVNPNGRYSYPNLAPYYSCSLEGMLNSSVWDIHSVKRHFDGHVFTVGDVVFDCTENVTILGFAISSADSNKMSFKYKEFAPMQLYRGMEHIKPSRKEIFRTEDGVILYEDDKASGTEVWFMDKNLINLVRVHWGGLHPNSNCIYFKDKSKAEEYKLMNKPCLSLKDVLNQTTFYNNLDAIESLRRVIKTRL